MCEESNHSGLSPDERAPVANPFAFECRWDGQEPRCHEEVAAEFMVAWGVLLGRFKEHAEVDGARMFWGARGAHEFGDGVVR